MKKRCAMCGIVKPWADFHTKTNWPDGSPRTVHAYCKRPCFQQYTNDWHKRKRASDPNWQKDRRSRQYVKLRSDAERWAATLDRQREWARRRYGYQRDLRNASDVGPSVLLSSAPFGRWLREIQSREGIDKRALAIRVGLGYRSLTAYMSGERADVELVRVERAIIEEGTATLMDVYPELYEGAAS